VFDTLFADFDQQLKEHGYLPMGGQIVDATLVAAPMRLARLPYAAAILRRIIAARRQNATNSSR
jgi:hypothetical protein